jgi:tetratricopeptide (TPR) repeat protein/predicted aspartyl protease
MKKFLLSDFFLPFLLLVSVAGQEAPLSSPSSSPAPATGSLSAPQQSMPELLDLGLKAYRTGKFDAAVEDYGAALQKDPTSADAYAGLARVYLKQERIQTAYETARKGVSQAPDSATAHTALGEVYFRQGRMEDCEKEFLKGVNATHPEARAYLGLTRLYDAYSLYAHAKKSLDKAYALDPKDPDIRRRWMQTLSRAERIRSLEDYLSSSTNDDDETRGALHRYLDLLKQREKEPRSCKLVSKLTATETALKPMLIDPTHFHGYGLEVKVNGYSSRLLLDTGASGLLIGKKMAEKTGIQQLVSSKLGGIGDKGLADAYVGYADSIKIGDLEFQNCLVEVSEKRSVLDDDGLIGADVFSHYLVTIDFPHQKLKLQELPKRPDEQQTSASLSTSQDDEDEEESSSQSGENQKEGSATTVATKAAVRSEPHDRYIAPEMKDYSRIFRFGHQLLIPTKVGDSDFKLFLIDTGASFNSISPDAAREVTKVHSDSNMRIRGLSGEVKQVYNADKAVLQFSHYRQENQDVVAFDLSTISKHTGTEVSGILGFTTLRVMSLKIDYRDGLVDFDYDAKRGH